LETRLPAPYFRSIWMFSFVPLLATETMIPTPSRMTTPITIQAGSTCWRMPSFQSAATPPATSRTNPTKYIPAHFMAHLLVGLVPAQFVDIRQDSPAPGWDMRDSRPTTRSLSRSDPRPWQEVLAVCPAQAARSGVHPRFHLF